MRFLIVAIFCLSLSGNITAQYKFKSEKLISCSQVKNQAKTGTCWSFATASFLESELIRLGMTNVNISEMYIVRNIYKDKARNYILRQGKANFSQGSLSHDLLRIATKNGIMTEEAYSGLVGVEQDHDHSEMSLGLKGFLDGIRKNKSLSPKWPIAFEKILDAYMGSVPEQFSYDGKLYTPTLFLEETGLQLDDYVSLSSFTHHPFYHKFILEIPDNYSNGSYHNIPIEELISTIDFALLAGYSIAWDGDVSEKGFSSKNGIAVLPENPTRSDLFTKPGEEIKVTQENRQANFESYATTDDHLMHIVGIALDQNGNKYYLIKNSWGETGPYEGYLYMSESYAKMKTISIMLHKNGLPSSTARKLSLNSN